MQALCVSLRILVADNEPDTVLALTRLLRDEGHLTRGVYCGADVLAAVQQFHPDVVLVDLAMPDRSGWDVAREIRATQGTERLLLIAISSLYGQASSPLLGSMGGFDYYLAKPCDPNVLLGLLRHL
ncbi:MAG TPA: response regulator [Burkholderiales bacterium]|nr:response regulator [Burkholderiales bacterium]